MAELKETVEVIDADTDRDYRLPDGGFAQVPKGDTVYITENGWVYHHPAEDEDGNTIEPDWDEVKASHSNPALIEDLLEESEETKGKK